MHYVEAKGILSAQNGMNLYRGCSHGCIYCDARSKCYRMEHDFEDIEVKSNAIELLEAALKRRRGRCMIGTGAMSDPYIPLESELRFTRRALEVIEKYGFGAAIQTKSGRILEDIDLLRRINEKSKCVVQMTLTTCSEALCRKIEPNVSTTQERFGALMALHEAGIPTVVWLCPILPFINDTAENISGILSLCRQAGVYGVICFGMGLTLREGNREYFYKRLDALFPGMKERYIRAYGDRYEVISPKNGELTDLFRRQCDEYGLVRDRERIFAYMRSFEQKEDIQLSLWE